jgi:hypothetical protein
MDTIYIEYKGKVHTFKKTEDILNNTMFLDRCWYILNNLSDPNVEALADMHVSRKQFDVSYMEKKNDT